MMKNSSKTAQSVKNNEFTKFQACALSLTQTKALKGGADGIGTEDELLT
ncbi:MAG: hypothetical protein AAF985_02165 [Bacteroidota bacterium]